MVKSSNIHLNPPIDLDSERTFIKTEENKLWELLNIESQKSDKNMQLISLYRGNLNYLGLMRHFLQASQRRIQKETEDKKGLAFLGPSFFERSLKEYCSQFWIFKNIIFNIILKIYKKGEKYLDEQIKYLINKKFRRYPSPSFMYFYLKESYPSK